MATAEITRRTVLGATVLGPLGLWPVAARSQAAWPSRPIKLIVPFAAGGSTDVIARSLEGRLGARLGQPLIIENRGGAGGTLGADFVAKSAPDGQTLLLGSTTLATAAATGTRLPYDTSRDLMPIGGIATTPLVVVVPASSGLKTLNELFVQARAKPGSINYGSGGNGSMSHLGMELLASEAKIQLVHVPYRGISLAFNDMMGGNLQVTISAFGSVAKLVEGGKLRALAISSPERSPFMPQVPTIAESGLPGFQIDFWWGLMGPAQLPAPIVRRLNDDLAAVLATSEVKDLFAREACTAQSSSPEALGKVVAFELARWGKLAKSANIKSE